MSQHQDRTPESLSRIQALTDELADALGRSVAVDNASLELLCASAQLGSIDQDRVAAIINRSPPPEPVPWLLSQGIQTSLGPVRLPANEKFALLPRVCFPIRHDGQLSGYLWLFDEPPVTQEELAEAADTVAQLAPIMHAADLALLQRAEDMDRLTIQLVSPSTSVAALEEAEARGYLSADGALVVQVLLIHPVADASNIFVASPGKDFRLKMARYRPGRPALLHYTQDRLVVITKDRSPRDTQAAQSSASRLVRTTGYAPTSTGRAKATSPQDLETAMRRAVFAAELAALLDQPLLDWEATGSWRLLYGNSLELSTVYNLSKDAQILIDMGTREQWQTVLSFLNAGRSIGPTCHELSIHRATLHYRLERVRDILGAQALDDGWRATSLHVALKLYAALQGEQRSAGADGKPSESQ